MMHSLKWRWIRDRAAAWVLRLALAGAIEDQGQRRGRAGQRQPDEPAAGDLG